jgi:hypothetical protein
VEQLRQYSVDGGSAARFRLKASPKKCGGFHEKRTRRAKYGAEVNGHHPRIDHSPEIRVGVFNTIPMSLLLHGSQNSPYPRNHPAWNSRRALWQDVSERGLCFPVLFIHERMEKLGFPVLSHARSGLVGGRMQHSQGFSAWSLLLFQYARVQIRCRTYEWEIIFTGIADSNPSLYRLKLSLPRPVCMMRNAESGSVATRPEKK